jgi:vacuole morphology and inheritance protein 14
MARSNDTEEIVEKAASFVHAVNLKHKEGEANALSSFAGANKSDNVAKREKSHTTPSTVAHKPEVKTQDQEAPVPGILPGNSKSATLDAAVVGTTSTSRQATNNKEQAQQQQQQNARNIGNGTWAAGGNGTSVGQANGGAGGGGDEEGNPLKFSSTILPQHVAATAQQLLPTSVLRNLYDKLYEKRKAAALEVEQIVKSLAGAGDLHRVHALLSLLVRDYALSPLSNHRKGGLIGLAAATVGLVGNFATFLPLIIPPVLRSFDDTDSRVRYYACEALYNMAKVARDDFATFFNDVFDALCKLSADVDPNVQNAAHLLDKLVKDIVTESPHFDLEEFIALLRQRLQVSNPYVRQFLVSWISVLDSVPDIDMLEYLPEFLEGLLSMLSDPNRDIRQQADAALGEFLAEIKHIQRTAECKNQVVVPFDVRNVVRILVERAGNSDEFTQLTALAWLHDFVGLFGVQLVAYFDHLLDAVLPSLSHTNMRMSQVAETTNKALLELDTSTSSNMFDAIATIRVIKKHLEVCTKVSVPQSGPNTPIESNIPYSSLTSRQSRPELILPDQQSNHHNSSNLRNAQDGGERTWLEALRWLSILLQRNHDEVLSMLDELLPLLFAATADGSETVVLKALEVEASIAKDTPEFQRLVAALLDRFRGEKGTQLLQSRGSLVIRRLCALLGAEKVYSTVSTLLVREKDLPFASTMVQALNLILLTAPELKQPRDTLKNVYHLLHNPLSSDNTTTNNNAQQEKAKELFESLYRSFSHSCCAVLSLCLHAGAYSHACDILNCLGIELELTTHQLMEMDRLVQLIESPMFTGTRMKLLEPAKHPALCKCLYGILTLLPQSKAFETLHSRLKSIPSVELVRLNELISQGGQLDTMHKKAKARKDSTAHHHSSHDVIPFERLLHVFYTCQQKHSKLYQDKLTETKA